MELLRLFKSRDWVALSGLGLFVAVLAAGGFSLLVFIQWGLFDLGTRLVGSPPSEMAAYLFALALYACIIALLAGVGLRYMDWHRRLPALLRGLCLLSFMQVIWAGVAQLVHSQPVLLLWLLGEGLLLGVSAPLIFNLSAGLVPGPARGLAAGLAVGVSLLLAAGLPVAWTMTTAALAMSLVLLLLAGSLTWLGYRRPAWFEALRQLALRPDYGRGRFVQLNRFGHPRVSGRLLALAALLFGLYLLDLLSGVRPLSSAASLSPGGLRFWLACLGFLGALLAGGLYARMNEKHLFVWVFGLFALAHLLAGFFARLLPDLALARLSLEVLTAALYAVVNLALWMDVSTAETIGVNSALAIAASGWMLRAVSAALVLRWPPQALPSQPLTSVDALVVLLFLVLLGRDLFSRSDRQAHQPAG